MNEPVYVGMDVEGIKVNPKVDFAWISHELLSEPTKAKFTKEVCDIYDGGYDDGRYFYDLGRSQRSSTGKWPLLSLCLAAIDGKTDDDLIALAEKTTQLNPGTDKLMEYLLERFDGRIYPITSSYPAVELPIAKKYDIPFTQVFTNGIQVRKENPKKDIIEEIERRSPMCILSENREELGKFLNEYKTTWEALATCYEQNSKTPNDAGINMRINDLLEYHDNLFEKVGNQKLRNVLEYLFLIERGVMGSHRKVDAMRSVKDNRRAWTFVDDGIVGAMPIDWAKGGFSVNTTNKHALSFSKLNVATADVSNLIPVYEAMLDGEFGPELKEKLDSERIRVFTPRDIQQDIETVISANKEMKNKLKALYVPVKM